jgi:hypothetical protein
MLGIALHKKKKKKGAYSVRVYLNYPGVRDLINEHCIAV